MNWKEVKEWIEQDRTNTKDDDWLEKTMEVVNFLYSEHEKIGQHLNTGCPCGTCVPRVMIGRSWWKNLGFNFPTDCAEGLREQGYRYYNEWYRGNME